MNLWRKPILAAVVAALTQGAGEARADDFVHWTLSPRDVQMSGMESEVSFSVDVAMHRDENVLPTLSLVWEVPEGTDLTHAVLLVALDGRPVTTIRALEGAMDETHHALKVKLPSIHEPGLHTLTVSTRMFEADTNCQAPRDGQAWVRLAASSEVVWKRSLAAQSPRSWLQEQRAVPSMARTQVESSSKGPLALAGFVEAVRGLQLQGLATTAGTAHARGTLTLALRPELELPGDTCASLLLERERLVLAARTEEGLLCGARSLASAQVWGTCTRSPCYLARSLERPSSSRLETLHEALAVWTLSDLQDGFTAYGEGNSEVAFAWVRPPSWTVRPTPVLNLAIAHSSLALIDAALSTVSLELNGRPIGTWMLEGEAGKQGWIRAAIPREEWGKDAWRFVLRTHLKRLPALACKGVHPHETWITVDATSNLEVPRDERGNDGIAEFLRKAEGKTLTVTIDPRLESAELHALGTLLATMRRSDVEVGGVCKGPCVTARRAEAGGTSLLQVTQKPDGERFWVPSAPGLNMPAVSANKTAAVRHDRSANTLEVLFAGADAPERLLPASSLNAPLALQVDDEWLELGKPSLLSGTVTVEAVRTAAAQPSLVPVEQKRLFRADLAFLALSLVALAGGGAWILRSRRDAGTRRREP